MTEIRDAKVRSILLELQAELDDLKGCVMVGQQRAAAVAWVLALSDGGMTTPDLAKMVGMADSSTRQMMRSLVKILPITRYRKRWYANDRLPEKARK